MFSKLISRYIKYKKFISSLAEVGKMGKEELLAVQNRNGKLESMVDDDLKRVLFKEFASGKVTQQYADGYLTALALRKSRTYPDWKE